MKHKKILAITSSIVLIGALVPIAFAANSPSVQPSPVATLQAKVTKPIQPDTPSPPETAPAAPVTPVEAPIVTPAAVPAAPVTPPAPETYLDWWHNLVATHSQEESNCFGGIMLEKYGGDLSVVSIPTLEAELSYATTNYKSICFALARHSQSPKGY